MKRIYIFVLVILLCSGIVHSFGIAVPYMPDNTLILQPGEKTTLEIELQANIPIVLDHNFFVISPHWVRGVGYTNPVALGGDRIIAPITLEIWAPEVFYYNDYDLHLYMEQVIPDQGVYAINFDDTITLYINGTPSVCENPPCVETSPFEEEIPTSNIIIYSLAGLVLLIVVLITLTNLR